MRNKQKKYVSKDEALIKLQKYCAYQDRCHQEVRTKLIEIGIYGDDLEEIMAHLVSDKFLNEERFARSFARGKFRMRRWGKTRIISQLRLKKISEYCIRKAMTEIDEKEYVLALVELIDKKRKSIKETDIFHIKNKIASYAVGKGFEIDLVWNILNEKY